MEHNFSTPEKTHHTISSTTINKANNYDGTITTTEVYTTMSKKTRINYDALIEQNVFTCDDGNEMKYYNALLKKGEFAVFVTEYGNKPMCFISIKTLEKIVALMDLSLKTAYDLVTYGFYSMEEYWELNKTVTEYQTTKPNDYVFDYKKQWKLHLEQSDKMNKLIMCNDVLGYVDEEILTRKGKDMSCRTLKEVSAEKEVDSGEKGKKGSTVKRFRMSQSLKKTTGKKEQDVVVEEEVIEENEFVIKKKKKIKCGNNEVKEIVIEEPKVSSFTDKVVNEEFVIETNQTNINNSSNVNDNTKLLENVFIIQPENDNESAKDKDTTFDSQITTTTITTESSSTTTLTTNNEQHKTSNNSLKIPKRPPKSNKTKQHTRVLSSSQTTTNTNQTLTVPHQQTKTKIKSTSKAKNVKVHKMKTNGSRSINVERIQCVLCKGLPVRPQQCEKCQSQFCTMCTYELKYPSLCSECGGKLSLMKEKKKATATFESNMTRIVSYKETPKLNNTQDNSNSSNNITQKDFYNANKDRYLDASWKDKLNTDNKDNNLTSHNTITNINTPTDTVNTNSNTNTMDLYSYEKVISTEKNDPIWSICYCPTLLQGKGAIVTGHSSGSIFAWSCDKYIKAKTYLEHSNKVYDIKNIYYTSTYRQIFVSVSEDRSLKIWESTSQHSTISIPSIYPIYTLDIHPSNYMIYGDKNKTLYCQYIDIGSKGQLIKDINFKLETNHNSFIWRVKLLSQSSLDNTYVISASENSLEIHKLEVNKKRFTLINEHKEAHKGLIHDIIEFGYEHDKFLTCGVDHFIKLWSVNEPLPLKVIDYLYDNTIFSLMEVKEKEILICGGYDKQMKLINTKDVLTSSSQQEQQVQSQFEYKRPESLYRIIPIVNNTIFSIASINYGCSSNVYLWGNISK